MLATLLLTLTTGITILFFFLIGKRHMGVVPALFLLFFIGNNIVVEQDQWQSYANIFKKYGLLISRTVLLIGLGAIMSFFHRDIYHIFLTLISINGLLFITASITRYADGISIFHRAYWITTLGFIILILFKFSLPLARKITQLMIALNVGLYAFIYFIVLKLIKSTTSEQKIIREILMLVTHILIIATIINIPDNNYYGLFGTQIYITALFTGIYFIQKQQNPYQPSPITATDIIQGKRVLEHQQNIQRLPTRIASIQKLTRETSEYTKMALSILNIITILTMMFLFWSSIGKVVNIRTIELIYWLSIILFTYNFITIKKIDYYYKIQRVFVFFIINFAIYLSLINVFGSEHNSVVWIAIGRNLLNSIAIFHSKQLLDKAIMVYHDYYYRIAANLVSTILNIGLIHKLLNLPDQLSFAIITFYLGIQGFLMYYNFNYIKKIKPDEEDFLSEEEPDGEKG